MFSWRLSFNGRSRGCCCQKFAIAGKTVESQSRGGHMSWPMPCEVRRNYGRSSTSIDASCTHGSTISNTTCFEQSVFVLLLEVWTLPGGWSLVYYREPIAEPLLWRLDGFPRDCELLTTATGWPTVEGQSSRKYQMGSVKERFPREATSKEIWWSRLVDCKEPVCPFAGTFVMIVGVLVTWAIYTQGQLLLWSSLIITGAVPGYK